MRKHVSWPLRRQSRDALRASPELSSTRPARGRRCRRPERRGTGLKRRIRAAMKGSFGMKAMTYATLAAKVLLTLAFLAAGLSKLAEVEMMVATFDAIGVGQWFRYVTGLIEVGGAVLLWVPGLQLIGAALLVCTMIGAALAHAFVLGPSMVPALVLGALGAFVAYRHRPAKG